ncbi:MAG TPA: hypothetical protein DCR40_16140 [Prolixibacteraceae bacterium]|nr:hypothetical protein [Prolixibacteraceae bacterium]
MKIITIYFLIFIPFITFGQLFPKVPEFRGNIKKVVEKRYGKELTTFRKDSGVFKPGKFSGWKYTYLFDENSILTKRTVTFKGKVRNECWYRTEPTGNRILKNEIIRDYSSGLREYTIEYENFTDSEGRIQKVNFWSKNDLESQKELFLFETNAEYKQEKLTAFIRHIILINGDTASGEKCSLEYDALDRLVRIDRKDISSGFSTSIQYYYNEKGLVDHYSIDLLSEIQEYGRGQIQDIYFKYDSRGNWTSMYWKSGRKDRLEAKRTIKYLNQP